MLGRRNTHENSDSESGFLDSRIFVAVVFCLTGIGLAFLSFASSPSGTATRTATYVAGNPAAAASPNDPAAPSALGFSTPIQMIRPLSPVFFQQGGEPEIKVDLFGNIYLTAIQGTPGGVDLWKSTDKGATFVYMGQPDGAQDKCTTIPQCAGFGGGDDAIDVSSGGYLYVSSLFGV